jgi:glutathione S-transferase
MMTLYWSSRSPFVRVVTVVAHELGLADRIAFKAVRVVGAEANDEVMAHNPFGRIPTLVLDDGTAIYDSLVICAYLDTLHDGRRLFPEPLRERLAALQRHALGDGLMEALIVWLGERLRQQPEQSDKRIAVSRRKVANALRCLESEAGNLGATPFDIGHAAIGAALAYMDFRFGAEPWREGHPRLARWHAEFSARPSAIATRFVDEKAATEPGKPATGDARR